MLDRIGFHISEVWNWGNSFSPFLCFNVFLSKESVGTLLVYKLISFGGDAFTKKDYFYFYFTQMVLVLNFFMNFVGNSPSTTLRVNYYYFICVIRLDYFRFTLDCPLLFCFLSA